MLNHTVRSTEEHERTHDLSLEEVHQAYDRVRGRQLGSAVFISDLATELQIGFQKLHEWIGSEVIESGHGSLGRESLADGDRAPTSGGDRTSRFQAASYPVLKLMVFCVFFWRAVSGPSLP